MWWLIGDGARVGAGWTSTLDAWELHSASSTEGAVAFRCCLLHAAGPQPSSLPLLANRELEGRGQLCAVAYLIAGRYVLWSICF